MPNPLPSPLILGHRGAPREAPENTLRSFDLAVRHGADGVELDVRRSRDGVPVVIHDDSLERTAGLRAAVEDHDWPALQRLTAAQLPSLAQAAAWAAGCGAWLNVEIKSAGVEAATLEVLAAAEVLERSFVSSFRPETVAEVGRLRPDARRFLLATRWDESVQDALAACGADGLCLRVDAATPLALEVLRREALPVVVWTVNDPQRMRELLRAGVTGLITDEPAVGSAARAEP